MGVYYKAASVNHQRLQLAYKQIKASPSIDILNVALSVGYETHSSFSRAFRKYFGVTPKDLANAALPKKRKKKSKTVRLMTDDGKYGVGQLNPESYPVFAIICGILAAVGALSTTLLTLKEVPYLRQPKSNATVFNLKLIYRDFMLALQNSQLRLVFICVLLSSAINGAMINLTIYMQTFFWGLGSGDLAWLSLAALGALGVFPFSSRIQKRWDKKHILIFCYILLPVKTFILMNLRFLDILPDNGDPGLLAILVAQGMLTVFLFILSGVISASISGDMLDDHELRTGRRQEGMFGAVTFFSEKAMTGVGTMIGGGILTLMSFPIHQSVADISQSNITSLGVVVGIIIPILYIIPTLLFTRYKITRERHAEIRTALDLQRKAQYERL